MPKFAPVLPAKFYPLVDFGDYHLMQAHTLLEEDNDDLIEWARDRGANVLRQHLILDNGLIELGHADPDTLIKACQRVFPDEAVCPDAAFDMDETCRLFQEYAAEIAKYVVSVMVVPQGRDMPEWMECTERLVFYAAEDGIDITIGVSRLINEFQDRLYMHDVTPRRVALAWLDDYMLRVDRNFHHQVHLLGMSDSLYRSKLEYKHLLVRGIDSTHPFTQAFFGHMMEAHTPKLDMPEEAWHTQAIQRGKTTRLAELNVAYISEAIRMGGPNV